MDPRALLEALCAVDSSTGREAALLPALRPALEALGARVDVQAFAPGRCNILATWGEPRLLFSTHLDTVPPYLPPRWDGDTLYGRGSCDAKGQIVAQLLAIDRLGRDGLAWLGVAGEETDSLGAQAALAWRDRFQGCRALVNGEPTELKVATGQRGVQNLRLSVAGVAAHGGSPERGRNALLELLDWLEGVRRLPLGRHPQLGGEAWNLGTLHGGEAVNVVPDRAEARINLRSVPGSTFRAAVAALRTPHGALDVEVDEPPCLYDDLPGFPMAPVPFGSDAPALRELIPSRRVALAGPGSITVAHTAMEHLTMPDLEAGARLNAALAAHFLERP